MIKKVITIAAAAALAACGPIAAISAIAQAIPPPAASTADESVAPAGSLQQGAETVIFRGAQAFALAEIAYTAIAQTAATLVRTGVIRGPNLDRLQSLNRQATDILRTGYAAASQAEKARQAARLLGIVDSIRAMTR